MRVTWTSPIILTALLSMLIVGCNSSSIYENPISQTMNPTAWRSGTVDPSGGSFGFSDIGITLDFPAGAIPDEETFTFSVRGFPGDVPTVPAGPVYIRLGTFQMTGDDMVFQEPVIVSFALSDYRSAGFAGRGFMINDSFAWEAAGTAPVQNDGMHAIMAIGEPGIYGAFDPVPLAVEMIVSRQSGTAPMSISVKAIPTGGTPPYDCVWYWGDNSTPDAGLTSSHLFKDPGDYQPSVLVMDAEGSSATDSLHLSIYSQADPTF